MADGCNGGRDLQLDGMDGSRCKCPDKQPSNGPARHSFILSAYLTVEKRVDEAKRQRINAVTRSHWTQQA